MFKDEFFPSIRATLVTLLLTGLAYPLAVTGVAFILLPNRARGSLVADEQGRVVGSELIAQPFAGGGYLQPRPSAAGEKGYDATSSGGSNLGATSKSLRERVEKEVRRLQQENGEARGPVPMELVTTSGSGLDPDISPEGALFQVPRIAKARNIPEERIRQLVEAHTDGRLLGLIGEPRVNVLALNLALDELAGE